MVILVKMIVCEIGKFVLKIIARIFIGAIFFLILVLFLLTFAIRIFTGIMF